MANHTTGAQRRNIHMNKVLAVAQAAKLEAARGNIDKALYEFMLVAGYEAGGMDFSAFNEMLDDIASYAPTA